jgi:hypothetical protein
MIHPMRMHARENKEITPDEKVVLASMIKMSKMLKLERSDNKNYPPQRLVIQGFTSNVALPPNGLSPIPFYVDINAPIKFVQMLHPTRTMVQVEYANIQTNNIDFPYGNGSFRIELPDIPAQHQWLDLYDHVWPATIGTDNGASVESRSSAVVFCGSASSSYLGNQFVNAQSVGFPITDLNYLNNNYIRIRVIFEPAKTGGGEGDPTIVATDMTLVFYTYSGMMDED